MFAICPVLLIDISSLSTLKIIFASCEDEQNIKGTIEAVINDHDTFDEK